MTQDLKDLLEKSGNNLHLEVADILESKGWDIDLSSYYYDDTENKPREIDIIATRNEGVGSEAKGESGKPIDKFDISLYIECKYFTKDIAFRMLPIGGLEQAAALHLNELNKEELVDFLNREADYLKNHYFDTKSVGKLHDTEIETTVFNALTQPIKSLVFSKDGEDHIKLNKIYVPIVVYSGIDGIYPIQGSQDLDKLQPLQHLPYGLNYAYRNVHTGFLKREYFIVDFVHKDIFNKFLTHRVQNDIGGIRRYLGTKHYAKELGKSLP